jgi:hypothetical protein
MDLYAQLAVAILAVFTNKMVGLSCDINDDDESN